MKNINMSHLIVMVGMLGYVFIQAGFEMTPEFARMEGRIFARLINGTHHLDVSDTSQSFDQNPIDADTESFAHDTERSMSENDANDPIKSGAATIQSGATRSVEDGFAMINSQPHHPRRKQ